MGTDPPASSTPLRQRMVLSIDDDARVRDRVTTHTAPCTNRWWICRTSHVR